MKIKNIEYYVEKAMWDKKKMLKETLETQAEMIYNEVRQILKPYGTITEGFDKEFNKDDVFFLMKRDGWKFVNEESDNDNIDTYIWERQDNKCHIYVDQKTNKITNYNIF